MSEYTTFEGSTLDDAIQSALDHFGLTRDKLEIEILSGGSTGIFGLVGKKQAQVRARPRGQVNVNMAMERDGQKNGGQSKGPSKGKGGTTAPRQPEQAEQAEQGADSNGNGQSDNKPKKKRRRGKRGGRGRSRNGYPIDENGEVNGNVMPPDEDEIPEVNGNVMPPPEEELPEVNGNVAPGQRPRPVREADGNRAPSGNKGKNSGRGGQQDRGRGPRQQAPKAYDDYDDGVGFEEHYGDYEDAPQFEVPPMPEEATYPLQDKALEADIREAVSRLILPLVGEVDDESIRIERTDEHIKVYIGGEEHAGVLIGREGQTLNSLQYLLNRMLARQHDPGVKIQLDAGRYRSRMDEKLRQMALFLANRATSTGKTQSTKPLSSYHRRVVHLTLQSDSAVSTESTGDGPMKRVLILPS